MTNPTTTETFEKLCWQWADIIILGESGVQLWPPLAGAHMRIKQFIANKETQKKVFGTANPRLLFIDANEIANFSFEDFETQVISELEISTQHLSLDSYLKINKRKLAVFFCGYDTALKNRNTDTLKKLGGILQKYSNFSVILFVDIDILTSSSFLTVTLKSNLFQNILYAPLYTYADSVQFFSYLEEKWQFKFDKNKTINLAKKIGGHYWLIKESARILRANQNFSMKEVLNSTTLVHKGIALFNMLNDEDQKNIYSILKNVQAEKISDYLSQTKIVVNGTLGLTYWYHIKNHILEMDNKYQNFSSALDVYFTAIERDIFELLLDKKTVITREDIAKALWGGNWEEKYSDWAIDQLIHRLRKKMIQANIQHRIVTKKGEGFIMTES